MTEPSFTNLLVVVAVAFAAPFLLGLAPRSPPAVDRPRDRRRDPGRTRRVRLGGGGHVDLGALGARAGLPALPCRARDRLRPVAGPAAEARATGYARLVRDRRCGRPGAQGPRADRVAAPDRDHPLRHLARGDHPGAQGLWPDLVAVRAARPRGRLDRRLRRGDPALDLLLRRGRRWLDADPDRQPRPAGCRDLLRRAGSRAFDADLGRPSAPPEHDGPDPGSRRGGVAGRLRGRRGGAWPRGDPRNVHGRGAPDADRPRRGDDPPRLPAEACRDRASASSSPSSSSRPGVRFDLNALFASTKA